MTSTEAPTVKVIGEIISVRTFNGIEYAAVRVGCHIVFARLVDVQEI